MAPSFFFAIACFISLGVAQRTIYSFGSSYTDTGFDPNGQQPSESNPLGNPVFGQVGEGGKKGTTGGGPNYIDHLVATFNTSLTFSYNYAVGGQVVNNALSHGSGIDLEHQVSESFAKKPLASPEDSLFIIFMGDNDVQYNYRESLPVDKVINDYFSYLDQLYQHNARRFMIVTVPQLDRAPTHNTTHDTPAQNKMLKDLIATYNAALKSQASNFKDKHQDIKLEIYDFNAYMGQVLDNPKSYGFQDATCEGSGPESNCIWWQPSPGHVTSSFHKKMTADMSGTTEALGW